MINQVSYVQSKNVLDLIWAGRDVQHSKKIARVRLGKLSALNSGTYFFWNGLDRLKTLKSVTWSHTVLEIGRFGCGLQVKGRQA